MNKKNILFFCLIIFLFGCATPTKNEIKQNETIAEVSKDQSQINQSQENNPIVDESKPGQVKFSYKDSSATRVAIAGDFNNWNSVKDWLIKNGDTWEIEILLAKGKHVYKFIVDGNWKIDPLNPDTEDDNLGGKNSVIIVK